MVIGFRLLIVGEVKVMVYDMVGKVFFYQEGYYDVGVYEFIIRGIELGVLGLFYYQL